MNLENCLLPNSIAAEQCLLGILLYDNSSFEKVGEFLLSEHFYEPIHGSIYEAISSFINSNKLANPITLGYHFKATGQLEGQEDYLTKIISNVPSLSGIADYGKQIHDLYLRRQLVLLSHKTIEEANTDKLEKDSNDMIESLEKSLFELGERGRLEGKAMTVGQSLPFVLSLAEKAFKKNTHIVGITSGFKSLDEMLGGFHPSDLVIVAGRPSMGKTALATNIAYNAAVSKADEGSVLFFSLEMSADQLSLRLLSSECGISSDRIRKGMIKAEDFALLMQATKKLSDVPFIIDDMAALNISVIRTRARRLHRKEKLKLIVIDYLQLICPEKASKDNRVEELSSITRGLKRIAKELNVPIIALSQLSRNVEMREDKRPQLSDLRGSGSIEQDADVVMFVYRDEYYKKDNKSKPSQWDSYAPPIDENASEIIIAKQRNGPIGTVRLKFDKGLTKFEDYK